LPATPARKAREGPGRLCTTLKAAGEGGGEKMFSKTCSLLPGLHLFRDYSHN
jgi:hypothetical protein